MKKALSYVATAIFLGVAIMLTPPMLVKLTTYGLVASGGQETVPEPRYCPEKALEGQGFLERAICPSNLSSVGLMLIPSFLFALGVSLYFKKRMF